MRPRGILAAVLVPLIAGFFSGCASDPFDWKETRPVPRQLVRQHLYTGTSRLMTGTYAEIYRAAARTFDATAYYSVSRDRNAIYADDFHGMSSAAVFLHPTETDGRARVEVLYLNEDMASFDPSRRKQAETGYLDDIEQTLAAMRGDAAPGADATAAAAAARGRLDADRRSARGTAVSAVDSVDGLPLRRRAKDWALIVGAERHAWLGDADYAARDAEVFQRYAETVLGVPRGNVIALRDADATRAQILAAIGRLRVAADPEARVWFYFAGHGGADETSGTPYLVPWDASPRYWSTTTLPLSELFRELGAVEAEQVVAVLDTSFSGPGDRTWNEADHSPEFKEKRPVAAIAGRLSVLYAAQPGESAKTLDDQGHGLMTYCLLRGLRGEAGTGRTLELEDLSRFVYREVRARGKAQGRAQSPHLDLAGPLTVVW